jgi:hypothetical protein
MNQEVEPDCIDNLNSLSSFTQDLMSEFNAPLPALMNLDD